MMCSGRKELHIFVSAGSSSENVELKRFEHDNNNHDLFSQCERNRNIFGLVKFANDDDDDDDPLMHLSTTVSFIYN